jgi:WD40 repeat protein
MAVRLTQVNACIFLSNGLLATAAGKVVSFWDVNACSMKHTLNHEGTVNALHLNTDGSLLATCGNDRKVTTWALPKGDRVKQLELDGWVRSPCSPRIPCLRSHVHVFV